MSHEVETLAYVGETPWHQLGVKLDAPPTSAEAIRAAGLDWEVGLRPLQTVAYEGIPSVDVDHRATFRKSDGKILGVVGPSYTPIQNASAFKWFDPFLDANEASIECAGSLQEGRRVFVLAKLNRAPSVIVPGDEVQKYILLANSHDGTIAGRVGFTPIRVVCQNTLSMALDGDVSKLIRVRHTKNAVDVLEAVRDTMNTADAQFEATAEQYRALARKNISAEDLEKYVRIVFPKTTKVVRAEVEEPGILLPGMVKPLPPVERESRNLETIRGLFEAGKGAQLPGVRGTYWAAYNAVTEFTTHVRGRTPENRLAAQFSDGAAINRRALTAALALAA